MDEVKKDEIFAKELLHQHYADKQTQPMQIWPNQSDPPDLFVQWSQKERWGIEVTRLYQKVQRIGNNGVVVSSEDVVKLFEAMAEEIERKTRKIRTHDYSLEIQDPTALSSPKRLIEKPEVKRWRKETIDTVCEHICLGRLETLREPGVILRPGGPGKRWSVYVGTGAHATEPALDYALQTTLGRKAQDLPSWNAGVSQRWLLILNCYVLADDSSVVGQIRRYLRASAQNGFDGVFWSGVKNRTLVEIPRT